MVSSSQGLFTIKRLRHHENQGLGRTTRDLSGPPETAVSYAAYGTLLREPRRALHARIAETFESQFAEIAENQPELLAHHCSEAGLVEKSAGL